MVDRAGVDTGGFGGGGSRGGGGAVRVFAWIGGIGCVLALVLVATCVGGAGYLFHQARSGAGDVVEPFFADIQAGRWDEAYDRLGPEWRSRMDPDEFREQFEPISERLGALRDLDVRRSRADVGTAVREIGYAATFERGSASVVVRLVPVEGGEDRIEGLRLDIRERGAEEPGPGSDGSGDPEIEESERP